MNDSWFTSFVFDHIGRWNMLAFIMGCECFEKVFPIKENALVIWLDMQILVRITIHPSP
ncbi:MAG: hypothetical protein RLP15_08820 [Cryomorphaceae bacterium]